MSMFTFPNLRIQMVEKMIMNKLGYLYKSSAAVWTQFNMTFFFISSLFMLIL